MLLRIEKWAAIMIGLVNKTLFADCGSDVLI